VPVLLYKLYGARTILNTIIQSLTPHNSMLNMSLVRHSVTVTSFAVKSFVGADIVVGTMRHSAAIRLKKIFNVLRSIALGSPRQ